MLLVYLSEAHIIILLTLSHAKHSAMGDHLCR